MYFPFGTDEWTFHLVAVRIENSSIHIPILHKSSKFERTLVTSSFVSIIHVNKIIFNVIVKVNIFNKNIIYEHIILFTNSHWMYIPFGTEYTKRNRITTGFECKIHLW